jgi:hypothetical protein
LSSLLAIRSLMNYSSALGFSLEDLRPLSARVPD